MTEYKAQDTDIVFALDIGTRSVVGIVGTAQGFGYRNGRA